MQIDLRTGVVPISRAASSLAALLKRCAASSGPIIVTQKGYPTGVLLSIADYTALVAGTERSGALAAALVAEEAEETETPTLGAAPEPEPAAEPETAPVKRRARKKV